MDSRLHGNDGRLLAAGPERLKDGASILYNAAHVDDTAYGASRPPLIQSREAGKVASW